MELGNKVAEVNGISLKEMNAAVISGFDIAS